MAWDLLNEAFIFDLVRTLLVTRKIRFDAAMSVLMKENNNLQFRQDINGLRAWAVVAVVLFHFDLMGLNGGFAGVDIFFVISGYLMTQITVSGLSENTFSIARFYAARGRRILPGLLTLLATLTILGWYWLPTVDYTNLGNEVASATGFVSNIFFWQSSGYFDSASSEKWLLHTWSLSVEAQFYVIYPLFLVLVWAMIPRLYAITVVVALIAIISFGLNIFLVDRAPSATFYLLPTRAWELALGGLAYLLPNWFKISKNGQRGLEVIGWVLVFSSLLLVDETLQWPGYLALMPVIGTVAIIIAHNERSTVTCTPIAQWLGNHSYAIYLWHWPVVVFLNFIDMADSLSANLNGLIFSITIAAITTKYIELPARRFLAKFKGPREFLLVGGLSASVVCVYILIPATVLQSRLPEAVDIAMNESTNTAPLDCFVNSKGIGEFGCEMPKGSDTDALLIGDSHSHALRSAVVNAAGSYGGNIGIRYWGASGCPTIRGALFADWTKRAPEICDNFNEHILATLNSEHFGIPAILISRANLALKGYNESNDPKPFVRFADVDQKDIEMEFSNRLVETACEIAKHRKVYLVRPIPEMGFNVPKRLSRQILLENDSSDVKIPISEYLERSRSVIAAQDLAVSTCNVAVLDPAKYLCDSEFCYGSIDGRPIYHDDDHLSEYGNKLLIPLFQSVFKAPERLEISVR